MTGEAFPGQAQTPIAHDPAERVLRLRTACAPEGRDFTHQGRAYRHQAAMIQGQTLDALCAWWPGSRPSALAGRASGWSGFWLVGRGPLGRPGGPGVWSPRIDIMHQPDQTFFVNDCQTGCATRFARHQDMRGRAAFATVVQVAVRAFHFHGRRCRFGGGPRIGRHADPRHRLSPVGLCAALSAGGPGG